MNDPLDLRVKRPLKPVTNAELSACTSWAKALQTTVALSGFVNEKALAAEIDIDPAQFTKTKCGQLGIMPDKLERLMDAAGTEFPLLWLCHQRGYDIEAMRQRETELQAELRLERDARIAAEAKLATVAEFFKQARAA